MKARRKAFTLVELLVALAVLSILVALTSELLGATLGLITHSVRNMDALTQANMVLDRIDIDLRRAVIRPDLKPAATINAGNDELRFFTAVPAYSGSRALSVVDYSVGSYSTNDPTALMRGVAGSSWLSSANPVPVVFGTSTTASDVSISANDVESMAPAVFRMELAFINKTDGSLKAQPANADWSDVTGMLVTVAALDSKSRLPLGANQATQIQSLSNLLQDFSGSTTNSDGSARIPVGVYAQWQTIANLQTKVTGMPALVQGQLRVVQRYYEW